MQTSSRCHYTVPPEVTQWLPNLPRPCIWLQAVRYEHTVLWQVVKVTVKTKIPPTTPNEAVPPVENYDWRHKQILTPISSNKRTSSVLQKSLLEHCSIFWELPATPLLSFVLFHSFVLYGCATWSLTERKFQEELAQLRRDDVGGNWGRRHNRKLHDLHTSPNIVRLIKTGRKRWVGNVARIV